MVNVRPLTQNDILQISNLEKQCFNSPWSEKGLKDTFQNGISTFFVAEFKNQIVGYIGIYSVLDEGYIYNLAVNPNFRKLGIGGKLVKTLITFGKEKKLNLVSLEVRESNIPAINLYTKCGFKVKGCRKNFYDKPKENGVIMSFEYIRN